MPTPTTSSVHGSWIGVTVMMVQVFLLYSIYIYYSIIPYISMRLVAYHMSISIHLMIHDEYGCFFGVFLFIHDAFGHY